MEFNVPLEDFWFGGKEYDLLVDNAAFQSIRKPLRVLKATGTYVGVGGSSSTLGFLQSLIVNPLIARMKGKKVVSFIANVNQADLVSYMSFWKLAKLCPS